MGGLKYIWINSKTESLLTIERLRLDQDCKTGSLSKWIQRFYPIIPPNPSSLKKSSEVLERHYKD